MTAARVGLALCYTIWVATVVLLLDDALSKPPKRLPLWERAVRWLRKRSTDV